MTKYELGQKVWVQGIVHQIDKSHNLDLEIEYKRIDGDMDTFWIGSNSPEIRTEAPQPPKPPAPVRLFGHTIFDLENVVEITPVLKSDYGDSDEECQEYWRFRLAILRGSSHDCTWFTFPTKEEAEEGRAEIEAKVLEAKGLAE